jgi:hypothetical protein
MLAASAEKRSISERKRNANRNNALRSTGPKTTQGKRNVSRNATKHGIFSAETLITAGDGKESAEELSALLEDCGNTTNRADFSKKHLWTRLPAAYGELKELFAPKTEKYECG